MALPKKLLNAGETLVVDSRPHWWYFSKNALALIVSFLVWVLIWRPRLRGPQRGLLS